MYELYTVLGYEKNLLIHEYRQKQFIKLIDIFQKNFSEELFSRFSKLSVLQQETFLFHPDQASILSCLFFIETPEKHKQKFQQECEKYLSGDISSLVAYSGYKIEGTQIYLTIEDNNPLNNVDIHPSGGGKLGWGEKTPAEWKEVYDATFALLSQIDIGFFSELSQMIQKIIAFGTAAQIHYSASYKECVGALYMGYTLDTDIPELHVLEGLIHESSHNKLNLMMQFQEITLNNYDEIYYSPYRPDARHMHGVFLGIHALTPTVYVLIQGVKKGCITDRRWLEKIVLYHIKNKLGIATVKKYAVLSDLGKKVFDDIIQVAQLSDPLVKEIITQFNLPVASIQAKAKEHFVQVNTKYSYLQY